MDADKREISDMSAENRCRVCIVGAGAIGCTIAARLSLGGQHVSVLARGETLAAIRQQGIVLHDLEGTHSVQVNASDDPARLGPQDVVFLCTKADALRHLLPTLAPLLGPDTVIIPAVNGVPWWYFSYHGGRFAGQRIEAVDPGGELSDAIEAQRLIGAVVFITAHVERPAVVRSTNPHLMIFGEPSGELTSRLQTLCSMLGDAGIEARATDRIRDTLWTKIIANLTSNPLSVVTGATLQQIYGHDELVPGVLNVLHEALLVAAAYGARVSLDPQTFLRMGEGMGAVRTSMLQDFDAGKPLELAAIGDAVVELAELQGISMPHTRNILSLARFRAAAQRAALQ
jgi:2-dehydropantoate 2-reductase